MFHAEEKESSSINIGRILFQLALLTSVIALDQMTKTFILSNYAVGQVEHITSYFDITLVFNHGAAFGLFRDLQPGTREVVLAVAKFIALAVVVFFMRSELGRSSSAQCGFALILGGAFGNIIDRVRLGAVVDFLSFHISNWFYYPAFNIADSAICVGVALLIFSRPPASDRRVTR